MNFILQMISIEITYKPCEKRNHHLFYFNINSRWMKGSNFLKIHRHKIACKWKYIYLGVSEDFEKPETTAWIHKQRMKGLEDIQNEGLSWPWCYRSLSSAAYAHPVLLSPAQDTAETPGSPFWECVQSSLVWASGITLLKGLLQEADERVKARVWGMASEHAHTQSALSHINS